MNLPIIILAGGLATRLRPITETIPKSMVTINGEPFIAHQLRLLKQQGFREIFLCLGYLGEQVEEYLNEKDSFGLKIHYLYDGPKLLGTAGAIKRIIQHLPEAFMVMYGDSYLLCDYAAAEQAFLASGKQALMTVFHNQGLWDKSNVIYKNGQILVYNKRQSLPEMQYIDYGLGAFRQEAFDEVPADQPFDLANLYESLLSKHQLIGVEVKQRFFEVGSFQGIKDLEAYLKTK